MQVPSDQNIPFNEKPAMQSAKITALGIEALKSGNYNQVRLNFPNPDMVGHTGDLEATISACTTVDKCVKVTPLTMCQFLCLGGLWCWVQERWAGVSTSKIGIWCWGQELLDATEEVGGIYLVTADHGNAEDMVQRDKKTGKPLMEGGKPRILTSHTLNPVRDPYVRSVPWSCCTWSRQLPSSDVARSDCAILKCCVCPTLSTPSKDHTLT